MIEGRWYWVCCKGEWFPAVYHKTAAGGWTNLDSWEDYDGDVQGFILIPLPEEIK